MIKVAIVGNIASGKSIVEKYLEKSYPVIDTDKITHDLLEKNQTKILEMFNKNDLLDNGFLSRKKLSNLVFSNKELLKKLENFLHPLIREEILKFFENNKNKKLIFVSVPLLFEAKFENLFDKIIFIYANDNLRLERLMKRNNLSKTEALKRINSQISQEKKITHCNYVIKNEQNLETLYEKVNIILKTLTD